MSKFARRPAVLALLALAALGGTSAAYVALPAAAVQAEDMAAAIAALKEVVKAGDENKIIAKITELESKNDPALTEEFADIGRTAKSDRVAKSAMKAAAKNKSESLFKWLKSKTDDKDMAKDHPERYLGVLDSLAFYMPTNPDKVALENLADVVKKYLASNPEISKRAITAYGSAREKPVVEQLIKWVVETDNTRGGGSGSGKSASAQTRENYGIAKSAALKALVALTGEEIEDPAAWEKWWKENGKTFTFPDANAAEPDFATLTAYTDGAYGYTIKKPADKFWTFQKCEVAGGRVTLVYKDDKSVLWARCNAITLKTWGEASNAAQFMAWFDKSFRNDDFEQFAKGGEPKIEEKKIGGREFSVITARGLGKGSWKAWESCERRIYVTMVSTNRFLYFECAARAGAEDVNKQQFWAAMDGIAFKAAK